MKTKKKNKPIRGTFTVTLPGGLTTGPIKHSASKGHVDAIIKAMHAINRRTVEKPQTIVIPAVMYRHMTGRG